MKQIFLRALLVLGICFCQFAPPLSADEGWKVALRQQLITEKACEIRLLSRIKEYELDAKRIVEGRAHCVNYAKYDFTWSPTKQKFDLKRCAPKYC